MMVSPSRRVSKSRSRRYAVHGFTPIVAAYSAGMSDGQRCSIDCGRHRAPRRREGAKGDRRAKTIHRKKSENKSYHACVADVWQRNKEVGIYPGMASVIRRFDTRVCQSV